MLTAVVVRCGLALSAVDQERKVTRARIAADFPRIQRQTLGLALRRYQRVVRGAGRCAGQVDNHEYYK